MTRSLFCFKYFIFLLSCYLVRSNSFAHVSLQHAFYCFSHISVSQGDIINSILMRCMAHATKYIVDTEESFDVRIIYIPRVEIYFMYICIYVIITHVLSF